MYIGGGTRAAHEKTFFWNPALGSGQFDLLDDKEQNSTAPTNFLSSNVGTALECFRLPGHPELIMNIQDFINVEQRQRADVAH